MDSVVAFAVFGVDWEFFKPYIVLGLALGGVYALSGVGIVVLYQATGVLNLAFGAIGAAGALIAYWMINHTSWPHWLAYVTCVAFGGAVNDSVLQDIEQTNQPVLGSEFFALHLGQGDVVDRNHAELGVQDAFVELLVPMVKLLELGVALDQCVDFRLRLPFEHGILLQQKNRRPFVERGAWPQHVTGSTPGTGPRERPPG